MKLSERYVCFVGVPQSVDGRSWEEQLAMWMIDNDIDANRVMDYIRQVEDTVFATTE